MIQTEIRVNGALIGLLYIRNIGRVPGSKPSRHIYAVEYYRPEKGVQTLSLEYNRRDEGIEKLICEILGRMEK